MTYYTFDSNFAKVFAKVASANSRSNEDALESDLWDSREFIHSEEDIRKLTRVAYSRFNLSKNAIVDPYPFSLEITFELAIEARREIEKELSLNLDTYTVMRRSLGLSSFILYYSARIDERENALLNANEVTFEIRYSLYEHIKDQQPELIY